ncbi:hypothetical protein HanIR_Chr11g0548751 [Helianthus annuus]|nr:hypothetical protein HanIR_Chr11g0548751 [Helianthus annuus]KAJ0518897.1 hypothetical protein HanHA89_Chr11g0442591 [Helianthus annuus]
MQVVTLSGSHGQILWGKSSCRFHILQLMIPMDPYPCFLIIYLQYLPVLDKLIKMKAEDVFNQRIETLALNLDKICDDKRVWNPKPAPSLLERLSPKEVSHIWKGEGSFVEELIQCIAPHLEDGYLSEVRSSIRPHDPSSSDDVLGALRKSLIWLRDEVRNLPCSPKCRHDAAADLIHIYAHTKFFFRVLVSLILFCSLTYFC